MRRIRNQVFNTWKLMPLSIALLFILFRHCDAMDVTLAWDRDSSVDGYMIYYKAGSSGPPYNGTDAAEGDSPIDVVWVTEFTLRGLSDDKRYYFAVTAYKDELESGYSNEVSTGRSVSVSSGGGGGGGGCFISTITEE